MNGRVRQEDFFEAALALLADQGATAMKQAPLCAALGVTTGSFYNHFRSWQDFTGQFLERWRTTRTLELVELAEQASTPLEVLDKMREMSLTLPFGAEAAIRAWTVTDPSVAEAQARVDRDRLDAICKAMRELFSDQDLAERYSRTAVYILVGFEQFELSPHEVGFLDWSLRCLLADIERASDR